MISDLGPKSQKASRAVEPAKQLRAQLPGIVYLWRELEKMDGEDMTDDELQAKGIIDCNLRRILESIRLNIEEIEMRDWGIEPPWERN